MNTSQINEMMNNSIPGPLYAAQGVGDETERNMKNEKIINTPPKSPSLFKRGVRGEFENESNSPPAPLSAAQRGGD
jgi:hypothetical protein